MAPYARPNSQNSEFDVVLWDLDNPLPTVEHKIIFSPLYDVRSTQPVLLICSETYTLQDINPYTTSRFFSQPLANKTVFITSTGIDYSVLTRHSYFENIILCSPYGGICISDKYNLYCQQIFIYEEKTQIINLPIIRKNERLVLLANLFSYSLFAVMTSATLSVQMRLYGLIRKIFYYAGIVGEHPNFRIRFLLDDIYSEIAKLKREPSLAAHHYSLNLLAPFEAIIQALIPPRYTLEEKSECILSNEQFHIPPRFMPLAPVLPMML